MWKEGKKRRTIIGKMNDRQAYICVEASNHGCIEKF